MQAIISSRHFKLFQEFKEEIFEALNEFDREAWSINKVEAILNRTHGSFQVELLVSGRSLHIESKSESSDLMGAFYKACERTSKQINKIMDKRNTTARKRLTKQTDARELM